MYYALYNNFLYNQLASAFIPQKDFDFVHDDTEVFFFFFFWKILKFLQKNFDPCQVLCLFF